MGKIARFVAGERQSDSRPAELSLTPVPAAEQIYDFVSPFTGTGIARVSALVAAAKYVIAANIPGDFVECGVWRGGSAMAIAMVLMTLAERRRIWLYDTFSGMVQPEEIDGLKAQRKWTKKGSDWCNASLDEVQQNVYRTGYPRSLLRFVEGKVEDTLPENVPEEIALLRLDTDWYRSTKHELTHLYPRLSLGGVLLIDDYGHWWGARMATQEYIAEQRLTIYLEYIDKTAVITIKGND